jgi:hypothetical protein
MWPVAEAGRAGVTRGARSVGAGLWWVVATETFDDAADEEGRDSRRWLGFAIALGIVVASISSAVAGAGAELYNERSTQSESLYRQALITLQQRERVFESDIASDLQQFGSYEREFLLGHLLQSDEQTATGELAARIRSDAVAAEQLAALDEQQNFVLALPGGYTAAAPTIDPTALYTAAVRNSSDLQRVDAAELHHETTTDRADAVDMTGVAAVFVFALVLLTLGQMRLGRAARTANGGASNAGTTLAGLGACVWLVGIALALVVVS